MSVIGKAGQAYCSVALLGACVTASSLLCGCTPDTIDGYFEMLPESAKTSGGGTSSAPNGLTPPAVCGSNSGFGSNAPAASAQDGLEATIRYFASTPPDESVSYYMANGTPILGAVIFNQVNVPELYFSSGFPLPAGANLPKSLGGKLTQSFALNYTSSLVLQAGDAEGDYEFATISDDGSILTLGSGTASSLVLDNETLNNSGVGKCQSATFRCSGQTNTPTFHMTMASEVPLSLQYVQGCPDYIAMQLLWRKVTLGSIDDGNCGNVYDSTADYTGMGGIPSDAYNKGWRVIPPGNFKLPAGVTNPCLTEN